MLRRCLTHWLASLLLVLVPFGTAQAGSFEDFFTAIRQDDVRSLQELASRGFDLNTTDAKGQPGLLLAIRDGSDRVAEFLIRHPQVKVDARNLQDETPLMLALLKGKLPLAKLLVQREADVNKPGWAPLHYAATLASPAASAQIRWLLEQHAYIDAESPNGTTPLMMAAQYGTEDAVRTLLEEGADPTGRNQLGLSASDFARRSGRMQLAASLAEYSARATAKPRTTQPPGGAGSLSSVPSTLQNPVHSQGLATTAAENSGAASVAPVVSPVSQSEAVQAAPLSPISLGVVPANQPVGLPPVAPANPAPKVMPIPASVSSPSPPVPPALPKVPQQPVAVPPPTKW